MGYINTNKVLGYLDNRMKSSDLSNAGEELRMLASIIITMPPERVRRDDVSIAERTNLNGRAVLYYCSSCRKLIKKGDVFCSKCGRRLQW